MDPQQSASQISAQGPKKSRSSLPVIIVLVVLLIGTLVFGYWAFSGRQDYKNKSDAKSAAAVKAAETVQAAQLQTKYDELSKSPYKVYQGPSTYGTVIFNYPKTWDAYIDTSASNEPINSYYYPGFVPGLQNGTAYALRLELVDTVYSQVVSGFSSALADGSLTASAFVPPKLQGVKNVQAGTLFKGAIGQDSSGNPLTGELLAIQVRDKTLEIYTQSQDFVSDFSNVVLPSLSFTP